MPGEKGENVTVSGAGLAARLLHWYDRHRRVMPWRAAPGARPEPYAVWLSEIMLQQTSVAAVRPYFEAFMARWPSVHALAGAELDAVLHAWQGLGYYARARNLHKCAGIVSRELGGRFPDTEADLRTLPGIGAYTGAAIASIAFDRPATVVDGNVERVTARLHGVDAPLCYQPTGDGEDPAAMDLMRRALEIRRDAGVSTDRFFGCFWGYGPQDDPELARRVLGEVIELTKSFGYREYYNYGPDEPGVEQTRQQIEPWRFLREEIGAKVYLAVSPGVWESKSPDRRKLWNQFKEVVNLFVAGGVPNPKWAERLHEAGLLIFNYANPQCGIEEPLTYPRNCGLLLWKTGYDGVTNYAYQATFGGEIMWNDFDRRADDSRGYRDHVMAYATSNGVVDTLQWEGRREAVDDLRYLSTLLEKIEEAKKDPALQRRAREVEAWVSTIEPNSDLNELRREIAVRILDLLPK